MQQITDRLRHVIQRQEITHVVDVELLFCVRWIFPKGGGMSTIDLMTSLWKSNTDKRTDVSKGSIFLYLKHSFMKNMISRKHGPVNETFDSIVDWCLTFMKKQVVKWCAEHSQFKQNLQMKSRVHLMCDALDCALFALAVLQFEDWFGLITQRRQIGD